MAGRRTGPDLDAEGALLWRRVTETVRPIRKARGAPRPSPVIAPDIVVDRVEKSRPKPADPVAVKVKAPAADTLDGGWDRRLRRGVAAPDRTIDLHGHTLASAHRMLDRELDDAILDGVRILLVITGRPPRADDRGADGRPRRGLIRATIGDWLGTSRHAARIAAVRNAHPKHGGQGALYVILRRSRET